MVCANSARAENETNDKTVKGFIGVPASPRGIADSRSRVNLTAIMDRSAERLPIRSGFGYWRQAGRGWEFEAMNIDPKPTKYRTFRGVKVGIADCFKPGGQIATEPWTRKLEGLIGSSNAATVQVEVRPTFCTCFRKSFLMRAKLRRSEMSIDVCPIQPRADVQSNPEYCALRAESNTCWPDVTPFRRS